MPTENDHPALQKLRACLAEEEAAYAEVLGALDRLAGFALPAEKAPEVRERLERLNSLWEVAERPAGGGLGGALRQRAWDAVAPALERQSDFNAALVQLLNAHLGPLEALHAHLREIASALVHYAQRVQPFVDARSRVASALATLRSELIIESLDRRVESLSALRSRMEAMTEEVHAVRAALETPPPPEVARAAEHAAEDSAYTAFENRFRGERDEIRLRVGEYVERFRDLAPVVDLGCGRGEFLEALRSAGITARGVEMNANAVRECREKDLDVTEGDLVDFLREQPDGSLGGVFAAQVAEHLPPPVLTALLAQAYRTLRSGGLLLLETPNPRSVTGLLEVFHRDLTHERPLHPETLCFLAAAAGFTEVWTELRSPVSPEHQLRPVPSEGLPEQAVSILNENLERLNALLYGPLEYALLARR
jgi:O-antigen chain-terminating methyltransferase